ncbi:uncharacterized protein [Typha angustifolia]|uniref:uncharacterized protein n=1 Tax=Typha angustifolia TaxID=59011 RepID=UPI003C2B6B34
MGNPKLKWTPEEAAALKAGVKKHGAGKWKTIQTDAEFSRYLANRSNIDLKDKWRNMNATAHGQGSREKTRTLKVKGPSDTQVSTTQSLAISVTLKDDKTTTTTTTTTTTSMDPARSSTDGKTSSRNSNAKRRDQERLASLEEAARSATYLVADAEAKSFLAAEAAKDCEEVAGLAEEMEAQLQLALEIYERCASGEIVLVELPGKNEGKEM